MKKVCCFGELLLRLPPANGGEWLRHNQLPVFVGGAELNVATALATWQLPVKYCTALPDNIISKDIRDYLDQKHIDTSSIILSGERIGLYYLKEGADMKSHENVFDRKYSSFSTLGTGIVDWDSILKDVSWFHFSAIAPAVSASAAALCLEALEAAKKKNITISVDLNFRSLLWKYGKEPIEVMPGLVQYCNVIMGNIWAANTLLGIPLHESLIAAKEYTAHATETAQEIFRRYPHSHWVANTFRFDGQADDIRYFATLDKRDGQVVSPLFQTHSVVDKVGSGDCFMAGLIYGISSGHSATEIIGYAAAAAFAKLQEKGDATQNSVEKIKTYLANPIIN
ncbi:MAG: sugar kinase [Chitinophagales bacterium]|nr:sugar kinase [Chitinophagales bacterium]